MRNSYLIAMITLIVPIGVIGMVIVVAVIILLLAGRAAPTAIPGG